MKPTEDDKKTVVFASEQETDCNDWIEILNKVLSGETLSNDEG